MDLVGRTRGLDSAVQLLSISQERHTQRLIIRIMRRCRRRHPLSRRLAS